MSTPATRISFLQILRGEILKTRRTRGLLLAIIGPLVVTMLVFGFHAENPPDVPQDMSPWKNFIRYVFQFFMLLYPLFAALIAFMLSNIEHKNRGFKYIFALPASKGAFYFSKVFVLLGWLALSLALSYVFIVIFGELLSVLLPNFAFAENSIPAETVLFLFRMFTILISIVAIHFFLSLYFDNFIIGVGSAVFLMIFGGVAANHRLAYLIPYTYPMDAYMGFMTGEIQAFDKRTLISLIYGVVFFVAGFWLVSKKNIK